MTDSEQRKGLWALMGKKQGSPPAPEDSPAKSTAETSVSSTNLTDSSQLPTPDSLGEVSNDPGCAVANLDSSSLAPPAPQVDQGEKELGEIPPSPVEIRSAGRGRGLWSIMQNAGEPPSSLPADHPSQEAPVPLIKEQLIKEQTRTADSEKSTPIVEHPLVAPNALTRRDRRLDALNNVASATGAIADTTNRERNTDIESHQSSQQEATHSSSPLSFQTSEQRAAVLRGIPRPTRTVSNQEIASISNSIEVDEEAQGTGQEAHSSATFRDSSLQTPTADRTAGQSSPERQLARSALWSLILGGLSLPVSLIAILPGFLTRVPPSLLGFSALIIGFTAIGEIQRLSGKRHGITHAVLGIVLGLAGMFAGPLVYSPLDTYGYLCDFYSRGHLEQIGAAMNEYHMLHQSYPNGGSFTSSKEQELQPMHGWMSSLLPYLTNQQDLAKRIDWSKPYDDPANLETYGTVVPQYLSAGNPSTLLRGKLAPTHFAGVGGMMTTADGSTVHLGVFDVNSAVQREEVIDGLSSTMIAGEIATDFPAWGSARNWRQIGKGINRSQNGFGNSRRTGALFLMADGSVRFFSNRTDLKVLQAVATRDGEDRP